MTDAATARSVAGSTVLRLLTASLVLPYVRVAYRIRGWGALPKPRGPTLVIANHQHDIDSMAIMSRLIIDGPWSKPIHTLSSRRMFEPGFFAVRTPWIAPLVRRYDPSALFLAIGPMPIENDLRRRVLTSVARSVRRRHGNVRVDEVLGASQSAELHISPEVRLDDLWSSKWFDAAQTEIELRLLREPHRSEMWDETRRLVTEDMARIEATLRAGETFFLTPEGHYTSDGAMLRFRDAFFRLEPLADVWLAAISYDVLRGRRLSQLYRIVRPEQRGNVPASLAAARPVTVSQIFASWLMRQGSRPFDVAQAEAGVREALRGLPVRLFVDPELRSHPRRVVEETLRRCLELGILLRRDATYELAEQRPHPRFGAVPDIVAFQATMFAETLAASATLDSA